MTHQKRHCHLRPMTTHFFLIFWKFYRKDHLVLIALWSFSKMTTRKMSCHRSTDENQVYTLLSVKKDDNMENALPSLYRWHPSKCVLICSERWHSNKYVVIFFQRWQHGKWVVIFLPMRIQKIRCHLLLKMTPQ